MAARSPKKCIHPNIQPARNLNTSSCFHFFPSHYPYFIQRKILFYSHHVCTNPKNTAYLLTKVMLHTFLSSKFKKLFQKRNISNEWSYLSHSSAMQVTSKWDRRFETSLNACSHFFKRPGEEVERNETWILVVPKRKVKIFERG